MTDPQIPSDQEEQHGVEVIELDELERETPQRPELTISEAAKACGVARSTIRRALDQGRLEGARKREGRLGVDSWEWVVPVDVLLQAGFTLHSPEQPAQPIALQGDDIDQQTPSIREMELRVKVAEVEGQRDKWETLAVERGRTIEQLTYTTKALMPGEQSAEKSKFQFTNAQFFFWFSLFSSAVCVLLLIIR